jgi:hypothetical protein
MPTSGAAVSSTAPGTAKAASFRNPSIETNGSLEDGESGGQPELPGLFSDSGNALPGPQSGASASVRLFGLCSGHSGKSKAEEVRARRRAGNPVSVGEGWEEQTGDIAHLDPIQYFAFSSPCQAYSYFIRQSVHRGDCGYSAQKGTTPPPGERRVHGASEPTNGSNFPMSVNQARLRSILSVCWKVL